MTEPTARRRIAHASVHRLGEQPGDDLSGSTTAGQRLAMMWPLALEAWAFAGRPVPTYARESMPVAVITRGTEETQRRP